MPYQDVLDEGRTTDNDISVDEKLALKTMKGSKENHSNVSIRNQRS